MTMGSIVLISLLEVMEENVASNGPSAERPAEVDIKVVVALRKDVPGTRVMFGLKERNTGGQERVGLPLWTVDCAGGGFEEAESAEVVGTKYEDPGLLAADGT